MNGLLEQARAIANEVTALRRDLHRHPEIAFEERRTAGVVADTLDGYGFDVRRGLGVTGVVAVRDGAAPGRTVLLRADMDALPVREVAGRSYGSTIDGAMHACGHDGHTAGLLGVARLFAEGRGELADWPGRLVLVFQPAEEIVRGAAAMLEDGALDGLEPDHAVALHYSANHPVGTIALAPGPTMAATDSFALRVVGAGGHAASPHQTRDPVVAAAQLVSALQSVVARETDPLGRAVVSITSVHGGSAFNIIPEAVDLKGTLRSFDAELRTRHRERILAIADGIAGALGCRLEAEWTEGAPAVVNDAAVAARMADVGRRLVGDDAVVPLTPIMGGDDMALWLQRAPGCYAMVGARNEAAGIDAPHHHPAFDLDEAALPIGVALLAGTARELLDPARS